ncbi:MAG: hypothetical protein K0S97_704 [Chloroflexota bacterium]|nr:hypothetical protein [Chloroflexota bacterium]
MAASTTVDEYMATLPPERRAAMELLRSTIKAAVPGATEVISYKMPAFKSHGGQFLVSYDAYKAHYSLFPATDAVIEACGDELTPHLFGSGTIRFPADKPIPVALVTKIIEIRWAENAAAEGR